MVFHFVFIPWLQMELDKYAFCYNRSAKRADTKSLLPRGLPEVIFQSPEGFDLRDYKVTVDPSIFDTVEAKYAPADHPVFKLVPEHFCELACQFYEKIGSPIVNEKSAWKTYSDLLLCFHALRDDALLSAEVAKVEAMPPVGQNPDDLMELLPGVPFRMGHCVVGDGVPIDEAEMSDDDDEEGEFSDDGLDDDYNAAAVELSFIP
jgi:hypothetical protein